MSVFTIIGAGMMGSAMSFPLRDNGHEVRIVGTPLDREIVERLKKDDHHANMKRTLPPGSVTSRSKIFPPSWREPTSSSVG